mgnify:CR=1 FL=1
MSGSQGAKSSERSFYSNRRLKTRAPFGGDLQIAPLARNSSKLDGLIGERNKNINDDIDNVSYGVNQLKTVKLEMIRRSMMVDRDSKREINTITNLKKSS